MKTTSSDALAPATEAARAVARRATPAHDVIVVRGAAEHNLRGIDVVLPRRALTVITGVSGSGKSSLAFDTIHAEGQRHYLDSLAAFSRRLLDRLRPPAVASITGLGPTLAVRQQVPANNPRSTVGSVTEIGDQLRLLYSRAGVATCRGCGDEVHHRTAAGILADLATLAASGPVEVSGPGWSHHVGAADIGARGRLPARLRTAVARSEATVLARAADGRVWHLGAGLVCRRCGTPARATSTQHFNRNSPEGMCPECEGLGQRLSIDAATLVARPEASIRAGALAFYGDRRRHPEKTYWPVRDVPELLGLFGADLDTRWIDLAPALREIILYGDTREPVTPARRRYLDQRRDTGLALELDRLFRAATTTDRKAFYGRFMAAQPCAACAGHGLSPDALAVHVAGDTIAAVGELTVPELLAWVDRAEAEVSDAVAARVVGEVAAEIRTRAAALVDAGLGYLNMSRRSPSLSAGESQRLRIARQLGCPLVDIVYVLDEPSVGLHPRDHQRLMAALRRLCATGSTVIMVEHDLDLIRGADWVVDLGPGGGVNGGRVVAIGPPERVAAEPASATGQWLRAGSARPHRVPRSAGRGQLSLRGASRHNLKKVDVDIPIGLFTCVVGVSGSGKSSLVTGTLEPALRLALAGVEPTGPFESLAGHEVLDRVVTVDQRPFGRSSRSVPATYVGIFDEIRRLFANGRDARDRGFTVAHFSFNSAAGQCPACAGLGDVTVEMHFLADVNAACPECDGARYRPEVLAARWDGRSIAEVLALDVDAALDFFAGQAAVTAPLATLATVGLGYLTLGQSCATLSGGEAQRLKLSRELGRAERGEGLYLIDEPTTGLHAADVARLTALLHGLVDAGDTLVVIEHNIDVIECADWLIELGPGAGPAGGEVIGMGARGR